MTATPEKQGTWLDDVPVEVEAAIAASAMRVSEVMALRPGDVIATGRRSGQTIDLFAGGAVIGSGELSTTGGKIQIRMVRLGSGA